MNAEIVATGSELVLGETVDTNSAYLARHLAAMGITVLRTTGVGDSEAHIKAAVEPAPRSRRPGDLHRRASAQLVDDVGPARRAGAGGRPAAGVPPASRRPGSPRASSPFGPHHERGNRRSRPYVPEGARIVENSARHRPILYRRDRARHGGGAAGRALRDALPVGARDHALSARRSRETGVILVRTLHAAGQGESVIGEMIADLMDQENPNVGISAKRAQYEIRIVAQSDSRAGAEALAEQCAAIIRERLGQYLIGDEKLAQQAMRAAARARPLAGALRGATTARRSIERSPICRPGGPCCAARSSTTRRSPGRRFCRRAPGPHGRSSSADRWRSDLALGVQAASTSGDDGFTNSGHRAGPRRWRARVAAPLRPQPR